MMIVNVLFVGFVIFSIFGFAEGIRLAVNEPVWIFIGILSVLLFNFLLLLVRQKSKNIKIVKNSLMWKIASNPVLKLTTIFTLWILAVGNFIYAHHWVGTPISRGAEYFEASVLSFMAFVLLIKKRPIK